MYMSALLELALKSPAKEPFVSMKAILTNTSSAQGTFIGNIYKPNIRRMTDDI